MKINTKKELEQFTCKNWKEINNYIDSQTEGIELPIYSSVDIRESKDKFAPVDNNIYPAGFNNLCTFDLVMASEKFKKFIEANYSSVKKIGIIPESNTKNKFYLDHLVTLKNLLVKAGFDIEVISFDQDLFSDEKELDLESNSEGNITFYPADIDANGIIKNTNNNNSYDLVILNHDQSSKINLPWEEITTPITPSPFIGWYQRQKTNHFKFYDQIVQNFSKHFDIDPNLMQAKFKAVQNIDFALKEGLDELGDNVDQLLFELPADSKVFIKASQGTYGMGIHVVQSGTEVRELNRKKRNKMDIGKNKIKFSTVLIQEGIETVLKYDDVPAEVTIYLIGGKGVGGFLRTNPLKGANENLNAKGMVFQKFCISEIQENADHQSKEAVYSTISRLSTLASALELKEILNK